MFLNNLTRKTIIPAVAVVGVVCGGAGVAQAMPGHAANTPDLISPSTTGDTQVDVSVESTDGSFGVSSQGYSFCVSPASKGKTPEVSIQKKPGVKVQTSTVIPSSPK